MDKAAAPVKAGLIPAIIAGCLVAFLGFGFAAAFGVFLQPMSADLGWGREVFSLSIALQALCWGMTQPLAGMVADRYGTARVLAFGAVIGATGFFLRGFFVCGFHVAFIGTHLPAYVVDRGLPLVVGAMSLALIGLFNIAGSFVAGWSGSVMLKKNFLSGIYFTRAIVITLFVLAPVSPMGVYIFSAAMGLLWLSTVPPTMGLVAQTQGLTFLSTLAGLVFLSHQTGSFLGAWLGGRMFDLTGDYTLMWWAAIGFGVLAAVIHMPIREPALQDAKT